MYIEAYRSCLVAHVPLSLRDTTHSILKSLSAQLDKPMAALLHEGALMLQAKYAAEEPTTQRRRAADRTPTPPTAA